MKMRKEREAWIDLLRGIAILAVVLDHTTFIFYYTARDALIGWHTFFSVNWFIFLSGITNTYSAQKKTRVFPTSVILFWKKKCGLYFQSLWAMTVSVIWSIFIFHQRIPNILLLIFTMKVDPHFYFLVVLFQLYLLFPFIYIAMKYSGKWYFRSLIVILIGLVSLKIFPLRIVPWYYVTPLEFIGAGYIFVFTLGMLYAFGVKRIERYISLFSLGCFLILEFDLLHSRGMFSTIIPNFKLILWSISLLMVVKSIVGVFTIADTPIGMLLRYLGRYSLPIYLFHFALLVIISRLQPALFIPKNLFIGLAYIASIGISLLLNMLFFSTTKVIMQKSGIRLPRFFQT